MYISIASIIILIIGIFLYRISNEARINFENKVRQGFPEKYRYIAGIMLLILAVILIFIFMPINAALLFSGVTIVSGTAGILVGVHINRKREE